MTNKFHKRLLSMYCMIYNGEYRTDKYIYRTDGYTDRVYRRAIGSRWDSWDEFRKINGKWALVA